MATQVTGRGTPAHNPARRRFSCWDKVKSCWEKTITALGIFWHCLSNQPTENPAETANNARAATAENQESQVRPRRNPADPGQTRTSNAGSLTTSTRDEAPAGQTLIASKSPVKETLTRLRLSQVNFPLLASPGPQTRRECFVQQQQQQQQQKLANFKILGEGGFGTVYQFYCQLDGGISACKVAKGSKEEGYVLSRQRFQQEFEAMQEFANTSYVVQPIHYDDGYQDNEPPIIFMELMEGGDLHDRNEYWFQNLSVSDQTLLREYKKEILEGGKAIASIMIKLHHMGWIHCDLKPANFLRDRAGGLKIADFGNAVKAEGKKFLPCGTAGFYAPEIIFGMTKDPERSKEIHKYGKKVDVYAFAITIWELASRDTSYSGELHGSEDCSGGPQVQKIQRLLHQVLNEKKRPYPPPLLIGRDFCKLLEDCWEEDPDDRPDFVVILEEPYQK